MDVMGMSSLFDFGSKVIEKIFPDPAQRAEAEVKLLEMKQNGELARMANETSIAKIDADDRNSARQREIAVKDRMPAILASGVTMGFFGILIFILTYGLPEKGGEALIMMLGSLATAWTGVVSYFFGSSSSSEKKTQMMANMTAR